MKLALGTAQLGMNYGVVNRAGKPSRADAVAIVRRARVGGVTTFDCARAYGDAEEILGEALDRNDSAVTTITKLQLPGFPKDVKSNDVHMAVDQSIEESSRSLGVSRLPVVLLHRWDHYRAWGGAAWQRLVELLHQGRIGALGASVYDPEEALDALSEPSVQHLQIPFNVLDWRWKEAGLDRAVLARPNTTVHARSVFLQGILLTHSATDWPEIAGFDPARILEQLQKLAQRFGREGLADLCLAYVRAQTWISWLVVGCETKKQLEEDLGLCLRSRLAEAECAELEREVPKIPVALLNPTLWGNSD